VFTSLDDHMWRLTYKWATYTHPNKPKTWVTARYYGRFPLCQGRVGHAVVREI